MSEEIFDIKSVSPSLENIYAKHHTSTQVIYIVFVVGLCIAMGLLPFLTVDVSTQSRGIITSLEDNNPVNAMVYGQIKNITMKEEMHVCQGDVLLEINTLQQNDKINTNIELLNENNRFIADLRKLVLQKDFSQDVELTTGFYLQEYLRLMKSLAETNLKIEFVNHELERRKQLFDSGAIARVDYEQKAHEQELLLKTKQSYIEQQKKQWQIELRQYQRENKQVNGENRNINIDKENYIVRASVSGFINNYKDLKPGNYVTPQEPIAYISSLDSLLVESYVATNDVGLIYEGMSIKYQVDAFHYNQWGLATGTVQSISSDIINVGDQPMFLVKCSLDQASLYLKNGYEGKLKKGMTVSSRYLIANRSLFELLYDKVDDWLNPNQNLQNT